SRAVKAGAAPTTLPSFPPRRSSDLTPPAAGEVTRLLQDAGRGRTGATDELLPLVYGHLRAIAQQRMSHERPGHTLQATALVHERSEEHTSELQSLTNLVCRLPHEKK